MKNGILIAFAVLFIGCSQQIIKPEVVTVVSYASLDSAQMKWEWTRGQLNRQIDSLNYDIRWLQADSSKDSIRIIQVPVKRGTVVTRSYSLDTTTSRGDSVHVKFTLGRYEGVTWIPPTWDVRVVPHPDTSSRVDVPRIVETVAPLVFGILPMWVVILIAAILVGGVLLFVFKK